MCLRPIDAHPLPTNLEFDIDQLIVEAAQAGDARTLDGGVGVEPDQVPQDLAFDGDGVVAGLALVGALGARGAGAEQRGIHGGQREVVAGRQRGLVQMHAGRGGGEDDVGDQDAHGPGAGQEVEAFVRVLRVDVDGGVFFEPLAHGVEADLDHVGEHGGGAGEVGREQHHLRQGFVVAVGALEAFDGELETAADDLGGGRAARDAVAGGEVDGEAGGLLEGFHRQVVLWVVRVFPDIEGGGGGGGEGVGDDGPVEEDPDAARSGFGFVRALTGQAAS